MLLKSSYETLESIAYRLLSHAGDHKIWLLEGPMGSGKTTLIKALCRALQTIHTVNSPTFSIINEYETIDHTPIYHFDCYRLNHIDDAIALDFESYFSSGCYCFIEWPSKIKAILPLHYFLITIEIETPTTRNLICTR
ncbi:MAG: tRNA (adenosine(37)-N6)-threonylcarbamoyltransferase complex ATPase subunit type 1 TsaE [Candidatus Cardinium sp.]|uniref:tRNA (adenosine(37)-N6)-threonylcarbamoyltransferase complex ATPase subunit type 1 TsaE n=1 Tax=Cardinium endosymbiont of Dermatophagoides farinae TaxID=2597823 RepID=UPI001182E5B0|nr:tRNA (adenosine(37)-N6)-threonylcarbamoyltransferase complex ATPase subunit type 1 TsaE [Cardinium endosymbiont of Dermatophagoides farinae]TSJ80992.1 tRNA (adenosine(37)-N6)-threonylcarbamoyltransferase complex ATPase subunit type 1 TsaE [Cardinium endosymbiont of Dermatophagoides farinae]UWW97018.1 MAG: tRNA (adenosine(37)-N6)-threonylcarbamoyltransferase complex ATPase subunit type 1 TsaE [Candidatus Cardinium sp.]